MGNLNYIVFGGVDSRDYGIYISGEGVFNAPERDVEVVNIPGKDGDLLIDRGRFLNIQVTYPGFNFEPDLSTFAERLRAFRAALASQAGYQRLEDSFHPDEFRLASFRDGLDVNPVMYNTASTFDIVFDCKPQRFLKSGEEEITIGQWGETQTVSGSIATFEAESNTGIKSLVVDINPVQSGSGDPSPDNVRPISGWSGVEVNRTGVNVWDEVSESGYISIADGTDQSGSAYARSKNYSKCLPNTSYYFRSSASQATSAILWYDADKNYISGEGARNQIVTSPSNAYYFRIYYDVSTYNHDISINYPSTDTEYHPYQGGTYHTDLGQTVYGGTLDIVSGELVVDRAMVDLGTLTWSYTANINIFYANISSMKAPTTSVDRRTGIVSSMFPVASNVLLDSTMDNNSMLRYSTNIYIRSTDYSDSATFKTAMNGVQLVYELATPQTYQLTPEQIETLLGVNNIWADSGEVSVEYGEDPNILVNPTPFEALPLIEVAGVGSLTVGNITVTITGDSTQDIFIDSDIMEAYEDDNGAIISRNDRISLSGMHFPTLGTDTGITYTGLTSVTVTPRWWTI